MNPAAVFFDIDGTLISLEIVIKSAREACRLNNIPIPTDEEIKKNLVGYTLESFLKRFDYKSEVVSKAQKDFLEFHKKWHYKYSPLYNFVPKTFDTLAERNIRIGLITSKHKTEAFDVVNYYKLKIDTLVSIDDVKEPKPNAEPILKACRNLWIRPQACIMVGDHVFDVMAAKAAGCTAVGVLTGRDNTASLKAAGADYIVEDASEVLNLID